MHITADTKQLRRVLDLVSRVSTKHITLPILQCVLLEAKSSFLYIRATNLEIGIEGKIAVTSDDDGVIAVPAQLLLQTINLITQSTVVLSFRGTAPATPETLSLRKSSAFSFFGGQFSE